MSSDALAVSIDFYFNKTHACNVIQVVSYDQLYHPKVPFFLVGLEPSLKGPDLKMHVKMVNIQIKLQVNVRKLFVIEKLIEDLLEGTELY